jgi:hypothetical protein
MVDWLPGAVLIMLCSIHAQSRMDNITSVQLCSALKSKGLVAPLKKLNASKRASVHKAFAAPLIGHMQLLPILRFGERYFGRPILSHTAFFEIIPLLQQATR